MVSARLPQLPRENRNLSECIDTDDSQDWWKEWRVKKHLAEMPPYSPATRQDGWKERDTVMLERSIVVLGEGKSRSEIRTDGLAGCLRTPRGGSSKQIVFTRRTGQSSDAVDESTGICPSSRLPGLSD